jgi:hypothetical protein
VPLSARLDEAASPATATRCSTSPATAPASRAPLTG